MPLRKYDWATAEKSYLSAPDDGRMTLKVISDEYDIPYQTVRRYAATHGWMTKRTKIIVRQRKMKMLSTAKNHMV